MDSAAFTERVRSFGRKWALWHRGSRILAAVSGGPDSLALLRVLSGLRKDEGFDLVCCVVNHHLRKEAGAEADFTASVASDLGIPCFIEEADVPAWRARFGGSVETAARVLRYEMLRSRAAASGCDTIAAAHHKDDQAETVLYRLVRGSGMTGLCGMAPRQGDIIRPLLSVTRRDIEAYLADFPYTPCHDQSNDVPDTARNLIRLEVMPLLRKINPQAGGAMCRAAESFREDEAYLRECLAPAVKELVWEDGRCRAGRKAILRLPPALGRRLLRAIWERLGAEVPAWEDTERILAFLASGRSGKWTSAAGVLVLQEYGEALFQRGSSRKGLPGESTPQEWELLQESFPTLPAAGPDQVVLDGDAAGPVRLCFLREGDRFAPPGMEGTKKLARYMNELHIPAGERRAWPLAGDDRHIYWIGFRRQSRLARPGEHTTHYLRLTLRRKHDGISHERH